MFYKLRQNHVLRSWDKTAWIVVRCFENNYRGLSVEEFQTLLLCDGITEFDADYITEEFFGDSR